MRRPWMRLSVVVGTVLVAVAAATAVREFKRYKYFFIPRRFQVVEAGHLYRGGQQKPGPLRRIIRTHGIRTILSLLPVDPAERRIAQEMGIDLRCIPLVDAADVGSCEPLESAAAILADTSKHPVFFHCYHGRSRSILVQAVYRIKHCGWTLDDTLDELRSTGFSPEENPYEYGLRKWLERYYLEFTARQSVSELTWE